MIRKIMLAVMLAASLFTCGCSGNNPGAGGGTSVEELPEKHMIEYDASMETVGDGMGAESFGGFLDEKNSRYYVVNDFYNMKSGGGLHIIPEFETYQQTAEYSCGPTSAVMVLNHYGNSEYNELEICSLSGTDTSKGTTVEGLAGFFEGIGWNVESNTSTKPRFETIEDAEKFIIEKIDNGTPVMVDWEDWAGHWEVIIGIDTCNGKSPYNDVLIMADPYDVTDHYQDGYYTVPFARFYDDMWREGPCAQKEVPYEQPYVVATPSP